MSLALIAVAVTAVAGQAWLQDLIALALGFPDRSDTSPDRSMSAAAPATAGPAPAYDCRLNLDTDAFTGADGTASEIGWEGNHQGVVTCLGGTFFVQDGVYRDFGFGVYDGAPTTWNDAEGYLPAQVTSFQRRGADIAITEFADQLVIDGNSYVAVYSRVAVRNATDRSIKVNPEPSPGLVPLTGAGNVVRPHRSVVHDYVVAVDRFGNDYPWPTRPSLTAAGGFDRHFAHMKSFWNGQLAQVAQISVPDTTLWTTPTAVDSSTPGNRPQWR